MHDDYHDQDFNCFLTSRMLHFLLDSADSQLWNLCQIGPKHVFDRDMDSPRNVLDLDSLYKCFFVELESLCVRFPLQMFPKSKPLYGTAFG